MKVVFTLNRVLIAALIVAGLISMGAIFARYPGLIQIQCSTEGCELIIDGRQS